MATATLSENMTTRQAGTLSGTNRDYISRARIVLRHCPDNAPLVLSGALSLDAAYEQAQEVKDNAQVEEIGMRKLRLEAPDLAERLDLGDFQPQLPLKPFRNHRAVTEIARGQRPTFPAE